MQIMSKIRPTNNSKKCIGTNIRLHITGNASLPRTYSQKKVWLEPPEVQQK